MSVSGWHGKLELAFALQDGATLMTHSQGTAPLKIQRPFYPEGAEVCHGVILHTAGGIVGGDRLRIDLQVAPSAHALITTAAASKIYRSNGQEAEQTIQISVGEGACLEWLPQEAIAFASAIYRQNLKIELAPGATWLGWEVTRFGRSASGERFTEGTWRSHTEVWQQGKPLWIDRQWLEGDRTILDSPHGLNGCAVVGSFALVGQPATPEIVEKIRRLWTEGQSAGKYNGEAGVSRLISGLLCRYRGNSNSEVRSWFRDVWQLLRLSYMQRSACLPRVWQM
ncbi:urease accessory protein UreD [Tumidithrix helvetica PCC 7403]|uniref:urease accessory protein UreD n=1 Tax=Tumidithrix helvetica TaxID=3457545 RepID=UPI003CA2EF85